MNNLFLKEFTYQYILLHDNLTKNEKLQIGKFVKEASDEQVMSLLLTGKCKNKLQEGEGKFVRNLFKSSPFIICERFINEYTLDASDEVVQSGVGGGMKWMRQLASKWATYKVPSETVDVGFGLKVTTPTDVNAWGTQYSSAMNAVKAGTPIAALVMAVLVIMVAKKAYKAYFSKAARACKGKGSRELIKRCIKEYETKALQFQIKELQSNISACASTKNPDKCRNTIKKKILKVQQKIQKK